MPKYTVRCIKCEKEKEIINSKPLITGDVSGVKCECGNDMVKKFIPYVINGNFGETSKYKAGG